MLVEKLIDFEDSISTIDIFSNISSEFSFSFRFKKKKSLLKILTFLKII
jgi:hypothetical protein